MRIHHHEYLNFSCTKGKRVLAIGLFDGCHKGHKSILNKVMAISKKREAISSILTFTSGNHKPKFKRINHPILQEEIFEQLGINELHYHNFDHSISSLTAEEFLNHILIKKLNIDTLILGSDAKLGNNRSCSAEEFKLLASKQNIDVVILDLKKENELSVSSTRIRESISKGNINQTNDLLGYPYTISGIVFKDQQRGRELGFPTANIDLTGYAHLPKGVYTAKIELNKCNQKEIFPAIAYIGSRPTLTEEPKIVCEVHIPKWNGDLYDQFIKLSNIEFIRPEQKFNSIESLKKQINQDLLQLNKD